MVQVLPVVLRDFNERMYIYAILRHLAEYIYKIEDKILGGSICLVKTYR